MIALPDFEVEFYGLRFATSLGARWAHFFNKGLGLEIKGVEAFSFCISEYSLPVLVTPSGGEPKWRELAEIEQRTRAGNCSLLISGPPNNATLFLFGGLPAGFLAGNIPSPFKIVKRTSALPVDGLQYEVELDTDNKLAARALLIAADLFLPRKEKSPFSNLEDVAFQQASNEQIGLSYLARMTGRTVLEIGVRMIELGIVPNNFDPGIDEESVIQSFDAFCRLSKLEQTIKLAQAGELDANYRIATEYALAVGDEAFGWCYEAARQGHKEAVEWMVMHSNSERLAWLQRTGGIGGTFSSGVSQILGWLRSFAQSGNIYAQVNLGENHLHGTVAARDLPRAFEYLKAASGNFPGGEVDANLCWGHVEASKLLGEYYMQGEVRHVGDAFNALEAALRDWTKVDEGYRESCESDWDDGDLASDDSEKQEIVALLESLCSDVVRTGDRRELAQLAVAIARACELPDRTRIATEVSERLAPKLPRSEQNWTRSEESILLKSFLGGTEIAELAVRHLRSPRSIENKLADLQSCKNSGNGADFDMSDELLD